MPRRKYVVVVMRDQRGWLAVAPKLNHMAGHGRTRAAALADLRDAVDGYFAVLRDEGRRPPPGDRDARLTELSVP